MAEIVNLRRARKNKSRAENAHNAAANRSAHGIAKPARDLAKARAEKSKRELDAHKLGES